MKNIIQGIKSIFNNDEKRRVICNYSNNYYGDQYCQSSMAKKEAK